MTTEINMIAIQIILYTIMGMGVIIYSIFEYAINRYRIRTFAKRAVGVN